MSSEFLHASIIESLALLLIPGLPLLLAAAILPGRWRTFFLRLAPWAALPALICAVLLPGIQLELPWLLLGVRLGVDEIGRVFLFFTAVLWLLAGIYGRSYLANDDRRTQFFGFYLLAMSGNLGLVVAQDVLSFFLFFTLMSFSAYGLIVHKQDAPAVRAGRIYISLVLLGEVLLFAGLVAGTVHAETLYLDRFAIAGQSNLVIALFFVGFSIKAGGLPFHVWLPLAHPIAPAPASAVLSGAMIKAGLLGWLRFLPLGQVALTEWGLFCVAAGIGAAWYGLLVGLSQRDPKTVLAYSSISHMGLMTAGVGIGMVAPEIWPLCLSVILIYATHHAFAKGALFLGVGVAAAGINKQVQRWSVVAGLILPALALAGLPLTSGAVAKSALKSLIHYLPAPWPNVLMVMLSLLAIGTTLLMVRFLYLVRPRASGEQRKTFGLSFPWAILLVVTGVWPWLAAETGQAALETISFTEFWRASWPVLAGALSAWIAWFLVRKAEERAMLRVPAGDILIVAEWILRRLGIACSFAANRLGKRGRKWLVFWHRPGAAFKNAYEQGPFEFRYLTWELAGIAFLALAILIFVTILTA